MGEIRKIVSKNIKDVIELSGVSRKIIAEKLGVSQVSVSNWIIGKNSPDLETLIKFCEMFDVSLDDIYDEKPITLKRDTNKDQLIEFYYQLNAVGQMKMLEYADDLIHSGKYVPFEYGPKEEESDETALSE